MKTNAIRMFLAIGAACVLGSALEAQTNDLKAKIPFAFHVNGQDFAAGNYIVYENGSLGVPTMKNVATKRSFFIIGADHSLNRGGDPKLVFHCYTGNNCFLAEIRLGSATGSRISMSKGEKEVANNDRNREMAAVSVGLRQTD